jgi:transposase-like protein
MSETAYSDDFKRVVVDKLIAGTASTVEIGRELQLPPHVIRRWFREAQQRSVTDAQKAAAVAKLNQPKSEAELLDQIPRKPVFLIDELQKGKTEVETMATPRAAVKKVYTREFKEAAVKKVKAAGGQVTQVLADEIGATPGTIRDWMKGEKLDSKERRQFDEKFKKAIAARIRAGESPNKISAEVDVVDSVIRRWAEKYGPKKKARAKAPFKYDDDTKRKTLELMEQLDSAEVVAKRMKINVGTVYKWLRDARNGKANSHAPKSNGEARHVKDAILYLKHASAALEQERSQGKHRERFRSHLLMELAYKELLGE